jgi:hypothetical protein
MQFESRLSPQGLPVTVQPVEPLQQFTGGKSALVIEICPVGKVS